MTSNEKLIRQAESFLGGAGRATLTGRLLLELKRLDAQIKEIVELKITAIKYDEGTLSAPAFLDITVEDGRVYHLKGKQAKREFKQYKVGDTYTASL